MQALLQSGALPASVSTAVTLGLDANGSQDLAQLLAACLPQRGVSYSEVADVLLEVSNVVTHARPEAQV